MFGSWPGGNSTSTTGPITWITFPVLTAYLLPCPSTTTHFERVALTWAPDRPQRVPTPGGVRKRVSWSATGPARILFQCFGSADDVHQFLRNRRLPRLVVI